MQRLKSDSIQVQKVHAGLAQIQKSKEFWSGFLLFLATAAILSAIPFFPIEIVFLASFFCAIIAIKKPEIAVILNSFLAILAIIYQSPALAFFFLLIFAIVLFRAHENWDIIAFLQILIFSPFALSGMQLAGILTIFGMSAASLYLGSKRSTLISIPSIVIVLLLSSIIMVENTAYLPIKLSNYGAGPEYRFVKPMLGIFDIPTNLINAVGNFLSFDNLIQIWSAVGSVTNNLITLIIADSLLIQIIFWGTSLYLLGYLPNKIEKRGQSIASFTLLIPIIGNYIISSLYAVPFRVEFVIEIGITIFALVALEQLGLNLSKESEVVRAEKMKAYGKFGMSDMSLSSSEKSLDELGGYEDVKSELKDAILVPLKKKEIAFAYGMKPPSGVLLFGPPGTGKTMMMRALAKELKFNFIEVRCAQILSQWVGEAEKNVVEVFDNARKNAPTILFFDEIDSLARKRGADIHDKVGSNVLTTLLQEMDGGIKSDRMVMVIGSTNIPNELDPAILRPGRFDKIIYMHLPDPLARKEIFRVHLSKIPTSEDIDLEVLTKKTERFSGADIKNIVNEAKEIAAKDAISKNKIIPISMDHLIQMISRVKPSTGIAQLEIYERFKLDFERRSSSAKKEEKKEERGIKWTDVVGLEKVKESLLETIELPLLHENEMKEMSIKPTKGILLFGPPGTGKTMIVKAAANELKASFQSISGAELMQKGYTQAVTVIKEVFNRARENTPAIIFIDEIETFAPSRGLGSSSEILGQFLSEMDGVKELKGVLVVGATNKPKNLDSAILRPGRFDKIFYIPPPDEKSREELFILNLGKITKEMEVEKLAKITPGFSGADIAAICQSIKMSKLKEKISGKDKSTISTATMVEMIKNRKPSITNELLEEYQRFMEEYGERN